MTITLTREEAQQVLDALEEIRYADISVSQKKAIETLRARLAQPEPDGPTPSEQYAFERGYQRALQVMREKNASHL